MSHVDEGTLHAYLDGALDTLPAAEAERVRRHLAACDVCRARLEEERAVRDEAAAILGGVMPDLGDLPSFEELRARARGTPAVPGFRLQKLVWAASVVLALGTGWMLRGGGLPQPERFDAREAAEARGTAGAEADARVPGGVAAGEQERTERPVRQPVPANVAAAVSEEMGPRPDVAAGAGVAPASKAAAEPDVARAARDPRATSGAVADDDSSGVAAIAPRPADLWAAARQRQDRPATQSLLPPSPAASDPLAARGTGAPLAREARRMINAAGSAIPVAADAFFQAGGSLVVPGLSVVSVAWMEERDLLGAVRVLQLMENGDTLELVHLPAGVAPALLPPVGDGRTQVLSPREGGWLVVRARASAEVLSALLRRLEGGN